MQVLYQSMNLGSTMEQNLNEKNWIGPLQDPVTWYGINYAGTQISYAVDFQNKRTLASPARLHFVLKFASQRKLFRTMWPDPAKGLFRVNQSQQTTDKLAYRDLVKYA